MKKGISLVITLLIASICSAQWSIDKGHSKVSFIVEHHGISEVDGVFKDYSASIDFSKDDFSDAVFQFTAKTASIFTDLEQRDNHLKSADIFDVEKYPVITFKSTSLEKMKGNKYKMVGNLTMKSVTKKIALEVTLNGPVENPNPQYDGLQIGFKAIGTLKRKDFNVGTTLMNIMVSDEIQIRVTGEFGVN